MFLIKYIIILQLFILKFCLKNYIRFLLIFGYVYQFGLLIAEDALEFQDGAELRVNPSTV